MLRDVVAAAYVGIDLAWGQRARTGIARLDGHGRLLDCRSVFTDEEVVAAFDGAAPDVVVAVDAPLLVSNPTGQRACERRVGQLFGARGASAHTSNLGRPHMSPPRAARLAELMGWSTDPATVPASGTPTCIEVYPHPAMLVLFGVPRVLTYKNKPGRSFEHLREQHLLLVDHVARVCEEPLRLTASADWAALVAALATATRKVDLRVVEDQVDAVLCAYLAWLWAQHPERMLVLPEDRAAAADDGFIVVPRPAGADGL